MGPKKTMLSAIQPTNIPHLGNYLGAIQNWVTMQNEFRCFFFAVDLHALTVPQDPKVLHENIFKTMAYNIACGLDPEHSVLFVQSHVREHAELAWILSCFTSMGELSRMTQFKDKSQKGDKNLNAGLFTYPSLMAADILLYKTDVVPVGEDQKQHIELTRNLAERFNNRFKSSVFKIPDPFIRESGARIMDLQDPTSKMSKSAANPSGVIFLSDTEKKISKKIKSAVTDSGQSVDMENASPGIQNLVDIRSIIEGKHPKDVGNEAQGKMYGTFKVETADLVCQHIMPIQRRANELLEDKGELEKVLKKGADAASEVATETLDQVKDVLGLVR